MTRYNGIEPDDDGVYVMYEDHLQALAASEQRVRELEGLVKRIQTNFIAHLADRNGDLYEQVKELVEYCNALCAEKNALAAQVAALEGQVAALVASLTEMYTVNAAAMRHLVVAGFEEAFITESHRLGITDGVGIRAKSALARATGGGMMADRIVGGITGWLPGEEDNIRQRLTTLEHRLCLAEAVCEAATKVIDDSPGTLGQAIGGLHEPLKAWNKARAPEGTP